MSSKNSKQSVLFIALFLTEFISFGLCCTDLEWTCMSGECIERDEKCDGVKHCEDGSDEKMELCFSLPCPTYAFRCAYGACVIGTARCNGKFECADDSDEISCHHTIENRYDDDDDGDDYEAEFATPENENCLYDQFKCNTGDCISLGDVCDGIRDCQDLSDENSNICAVYECPAFAYRCNYGACISTKKLCNGKWDCVDGSDEDSKLCANDTKQKPTSEPWSASTTITQLLIDDTESTLTSSNTSHTSPYPSHASSNTIHSTTGTSSMPTPTSSGCIVPSIPYSRVVYENDHRRVIPFGETVPHGTTINYECKHGYTHIGTTYNTCLNRKWTVEPDPKCIKYCPANVLTDGVTFKADCKKDGIAVSCKDRIAPGTVATITCATRYRKPIWNPTDHLQCGDDGEWDYQPYRCEPICGDEMFATTDRGRRNTTYVPWHVGIYSNMFLERYSYICSGTIISAKVVISAAYCFWDNQQQTLYKRSQLAVGAGKYHSDYYTHELNSEFQNIAAIHIESEFETDISHSKSDIAILILTNFLRFSPFIGPVCINWKDVGYHYKIDGKIDGQIAWHLKENGILQTAIVPTSSNNVCKEEFTSQWANAVTNDKFCVSNRCDQKMCQADNGGGFTVNRGNKHYLWGVVSAGTPLEMDLGFVIYTNIKHYQEIVMDRQFYNRPK